jgi:hypothetical protein
MHRMNRTSPYVVAAACLCLAAGGALRQANSQAAAPALDYEFFKAKVEPVFLTKRPGHTRCVVCHTINNAPLHLVPLSPGSAAWNEEQSRRNFQLIQKVVVPGYEDSRLIKHPLARGGWWRSPSRWRPAIPLERRPLLADTEDICAWGEAEVLISP